MKAQYVLIEKFGGPDVMQWAERELPAPAEGEVMLRHTVIGLNFIDVYHRTGLYPPELPSGLGREAAGVVEAVGANVTDLEPGDRVVYAGGALGAYSTARIIDASLLVPLPDDVADETAGAVLLKGLTAWYLLHESYPVSPGDPILIYAAAGGVGSLACQWAKALGAEIFGIVGSPEKAQLAESYGCDRVFLADEDDIPGKVKSLTGGRGVAAAYDSVGRDTFWQSLDCLRPKGTLVSFGNASGPVEPFPLGELAKRGSLYVTRPTLETFVATREELLAAAGKLFAFLREHEPVVRIGQRYPLEQVADAHRDLEARKTTGSTLLLP